MANDHSTYENMRGYARMNFQKLSDVADGLGHPGQTKNPRDKPSDYSIKMERATGLEPATPSLGSLYSTS